MSSDPYALLTPGQQHLVDEAAKVAHRALCACGKAYYAVPAVERDMYRTLAMENIVAAARRGGMIR